jgi:hypothetical protein
MKNKIDNIIITDLTSTQEDTIWAFLDKEGFTQRLNSKFIADNDIAVRIFDNKFVSSSSSGYKKYKMMNMKPYCDCIFMDYNDFNEKFFKINIPKTKENTIKISKENTKDSSAINIIELTKDKIIQAYNYTQSVDIRRLLIDLYGKELFTEKSFKIGNKFQYNGHTDKQYTLVKINTDVVTLIDSNAENFSCARSVKDPYNITESEMKAWLGVHWDKFKLL